jgi:hypothetical protein
METTVGVLVAVVSGGVGSDRITKPVEKEPF